MSILISDVIAAARLKYGDLETNDAVTYLKIILPEVRSKLNIRRTTISITTLAVGTREYALSELALGVDEVRYQRTSTTSDFKRLIGLSGKEEAYAKIAEFQKLSNGEPHWFYLSTGTTGPVIGFIPAPGTATSGGYPKVDIDITQHETITSGTTIYDDLPSMEVYVEGLKWKFAEDNYPEEAPGLEKAFRAAINRAQAYLLTKNRQAPPQMTPRVLRKRVPVR